MTLPESIFDYEACLAACARGERQALQGLYTQESARLLGVTQRIARDPALAEDIVHDAFLKIWQRAGSYDPARGSARGWIFSVTRHLALNFVRDNAWERQVEDLEHVMHLEAPTETADGPLGSGRLYGCLDQLDAERRTCLLHAYVDGYSHGQIAEKTGTPLGTVKAWIKRSLTALRECMG